MACPFSMVTVLKYNGPPESIFLMLLQEQPIDCALFIEDEKGDKDKNNKVKTVIIFLV